MQPTTEAHAHSSAMPAQSTADETRSGQTVECPMEALCRRAIQKAPFGIFFSLVGVALLTGGVLVLVEPAFLRGLLAGTSIVLGVLMLAAALVLAKLAEPFREET